VNEAGFESGNEAFCDGRDLAWLQDTDEAEVWSAWQVVYRDVLLVDRQGELVGVFNLTDNDLGDAVAMDQLRQALVELAEDAPTR
jgi:hypothetical protein